MPDIHVDGPDENISVPTDDPDNFLAFTTTVNGKPVATKVEQRVIAVGLDRTQLLRSLGIPLAPHLIKHQRGARPPAARTSGTSSCGSASPRSRNTTPARACRSISQRAGRCRRRTTGSRPSRRRRKPLIEHRYKPSVGASVQTALGSPNESKEPWYEDYKEKYCFDYEFLAAVERARRAVNSKSGAPYSEQRIDYILKTGANWSGPIKEFRLVVDKGEADNLITFCGQNVKKISDTQFELRRVDFTPDGNLSILILKRLQL